MANLTYIDTVKRSRIIDSIEQVPSVFEKFVQLLNDCEISTENPDEVIRSFFNPNVLTDAVQAEAEAYFERTQTPKVLRANQLKQMLNSITDEARQRLKDIRDEMRYLDLGLNPGDIRFHYRKYQITDAKRDALLSPTSRTLTDEEQKDYNAIVEVIQKAKPLREHNNIKAILSYFIGDKMNPQNDKPLDELLLMFLRCRELSKSEVETRDRERAEAERKADEEILQQIEAERKAELSELKKRQKSGETVENVPKSFISAIKGLHAHHKASKQRFGTFEPEGDEPQPTAE